MWSFRGRIVEKGDSYLINGQLKTSFSEEVILIFFLIGAIFGAMMLPYSIFLGREFSVEDYMVVLIGFPLCLFLARATMMRPIFFASVKSILEIKELLGKYESENAS